MIIKEACVENYSEAKNSEKLGANRIELCENLSVGGTTPSYGTIKKCLKDLKIPTFVMIRPRGGNFCYSKEEIEIMVEDIRMCKELGVPGIVLGVLTSNNKIDYPLLKSLLKKAQEMEVTFHKAIDELDNPIDEVERLAALGIQRILTSGKAEKALDGKNVLNEMLEKSKMTPLKIVVAGKVTRENFVKVKNTISSTEFHGKLIVGELS
jgi:copper homeostasis protein